MIGARVAAARHDSKDMKKLSLVRFHVWLACIAKLVSALLMLPLSLLKEKLMRFSHAPWKAVSGNASLKEQLLASISCRPSVA